MLKNSKSLTIGLVTIIFIGIVAFFLLKNTPKSTEIAVVPQAQAAALTPAPGAPETATPTEPTVKTSSPAAASGDVAAAMQDRVMGSETAPVTVIEYASLTCPHCAHFTTELLPEIKKRLIDTGKLKYIYRDFPLDQFALKASMMARCISADQYFNMIEVIFSNQDRWAHGKDPMEGLAQLGSLAGMDEAAFKSCTQNHALETALLNGVQEAQTKYHIESTPTFIFNGGVEQVKGAQTADQVEEIVNKLTRGK